nr:hypothetical protein [Hyphomonas sp. Mor2]
MVTKIETDYLIIGGGAAAFAFADIILSETEFSVTVVDRYHQPGGHWNFAYPFVRLHQPSSGYGVESRELGSGAIDKQGWNEGLQELASTGEILAYYDQLLHQDFLPTGRFHYYPMCEYTEDGAFSSIVTGEQFQATIRKKLVDSTHQKVVVPAMRPPQYPVSEGVDCVSPDRIAKLNKGYENYTVVGAGKTAIDTCLWLMGQGLSPDRIRWIMPRDSWLINRIHTQPGPEFQDHYVKYLEAQFAAVMGSDDADAMFAQLEQAGALLRLDPSVEPTMYRCATVSEKELQHLRAIKNVVRKGRVESIERDKIVLEQGSEQFEASTLFIDCTADGLEKRPSLPVFDGDLITLQSVRPCQQVFSASLIAHCEAAYSDQAEQNEICRPVSHPDTHIDWLRVSLETCRCESLWASKPELRKWLLNSRLNWLWRLGPELPQDPEALDQSFQMRTAMLQAMGQKFEQILANYS